MYEYLTIEECEKQFINPTKTCPFQLCYVRPVEETIYDYTPESKLFMKTDPEYLVWEKRNKEVFDKELKENGHAVYHLNPLHYKIQMQYYPNPELEKGKYIAYFTPLPLDKQWGDDWNDTPYEYNAEEPYDFHYEDNKKRIQHIIKCIYFTPKESCILPKDYSIHGNSFFSVDIINRGAIAWLFNGKKAIHAGCELLTFLKEIKDF